VSRRAFLAVCRLLLLGYPGDFRRRFGAEMTQLAEECDGSRLVVLADLAISAGREQWQVLRASTSLPRVCMAVLTIGLAGGLLARPHPGLEPLTGVLQPAADGAPAALGPMLQRVVAVLPGVADPTVAFVLVVVGLYGLIAEMSTPGAWFPGALGLLSLSGGLLGLAATPVNPLGLALLIASMAVFLAGIKVPLHGLPADVGVLLFVAGALTLFDGGAGISGPVIAAAVAGTSLFFGVLARLGAAARSLPPAMGPDELLGRVAQTRTAIAPAGQVFIRGERWAALCDEPVAAGAAVEVVAVRGLTLTVRPVAV
jgi:membrane protein implicated in regulation of membrane protease activity